MRRELRPILALLLAAVALCLIFRQWPQIDLAATQYFYDSGAHRFDPFLHLLGLVCKRGIYIFNDVWIPLLIAGNLIFFLNRARTQWLGLNRAQWAFLIAVMALGPGLSVAVAKQYFHRPRPVEIVQFGGTQPYVPPFARGTAHGESFFSGHAATGFYFCAFALLERRHRRRRYAFGLLLGGIIGLSRIIMGAHFVSDILFSGLFMLLVMYLLLATIFRNRLNP